MVKAKWSCGLIAAAVFALDFLSKSATNLFIPLMNNSVPRYPYGGIGIFKNFLGIEFSISHTINTGAAWGIFSDFPQALLALRIILLMVLFTYLCWFNKNRAWTIPLTLICVGATSNVIDFFIYGHVIDMLHFVFWGYDYPVFNIADSAIFIGVSWMLIHSFLYSETKRVNI